MAETSSGNRWLRPRAHQPLRSIDLVRIVVALIILTHPLYTLLHPPLVQALGASLAARGLPWGLGLAWLALVFQLVCALALLTRRLIVPATVGTMLVLAGGAILLYAPYWYVAGGAADDDHPGAELNVLLLACLAGVLSAYWPRRGVTREQAAQRGLDIVRVSSALLLSAHPLHAFIDLPGMRSWGEAMSARGFPFGVPLVWGVVITQLLSSTALVTRRLVVPGCVGHIAVLIMGIILVHLPHWFMIGPGQNGVEFPLVFIACFVACLLAYWPRHESAAGAAAVAASMKQAS